MQKVSYFKNIFKNIFFPTHKYRLAHKILTLWNMKIKQMVLSSNQFQPLQICLSLSCPVKKCNGQSSPKRWCWPSSLCLYVKFLLGLTPSLGCQPQQDLHKDVFTLPPHRCKLLITSVLSHPPWLSYSPFSMCGQPENHLMSAPEMRSVSHCVVYHVI